MRLPRLELVVFTSLSLAAVACTKEPGGSASAGETEPTTDEPATEGDPTAATEPTTDEPATEGESATDPEATETGPAATEGEVTEGTDTETGGVPTLCTDPPDPAVSAAYAIEGPGWLPTEGFANFGADLTCTVAAVAVDAGVVTTELACELDGEPQTATFKLPAAPEGEVDWKADDSVKLHVSQSEEFSAFQAVRLQTADDAILAVAVRGGADNGLGSVFKPLLHTIVMACGDSFDEILPAAIEFGIVDGATEVIFSGHRGVLPIDEERVFSIDVARVEVGHCCHYSDEQEVVLRRVKTGA